MSIYNQAFPDNTYQEYVLYKYILYVLYIYIFNKNYLNGKGS